VIRRRASFSDLQLFGAYSEYHSDKLKHTEKTAPTRLAASPEPSLHVI
jgi:hypothetical protein